jgi:hypothetical protein
MCWHTLPALEQLFAMQDVLGDGLGQWGFQVPEIFAFQCKQKQGTCGPHLVKELERRRSRVSRHTVLKHLIDDALRA